MTDYDPRADTGIPTEPVGSLPRPSAAAGRVRGLRRRQDQQGRSWRPSRTRPCRTRSAHRGRPARRSSPTASSAGRASRRTRSPTRSAGTGLRRTSGGGGQYFAIFADGHNRQLPRLTGGPFRYKTYAADTLAKSIGYATKPMKQAVIAPSMLALLYPLDEERRGLPAASSSRRTWSTSARRTSGGRSRPARVRVSIDFTEGRLATRADPRNPWTGRGMLAHFIELNNRVLRPLQRRRSGQHRRAHLPRRRPRLGAQRGRALQRPAAEHVPASTPATSSSSWPASGTRTRCTS